MAEQVLSSRAVGAKAAGAAREPVVASHQRQKGLWSFLTWAFFISQVLGMQQAFAAAARLETATDDTAADHGADPGQMTSDPLQPAGKFTGEAIAAAEALAGEASAPDPMAPIVGYAPRELAGGDSQNLLQAPAAPLALALGGEALLDNAPSALAQSAIETGGPADSTLPPIVVEIVPPIVGEVILPVIGEVIAPVLDAVGDILDPVLEQVVEPVTALAGDVLQAVDPVLEQVAEPVTALAGDVLQVVDPVLEQVVEPVTALAGDVLQVVEPVLEQVAEPVTELAGDVLQAVDPVLEQVAEPVTELAGDVLQAVEPVLEQVVEPVTELVGDAMQAIDGGGGSLLNMLLDLEVSGEEPIALVTAGISDPEGASISASLNPDDLFSDGNYTDYSIVLQTEAPAGSELLSVSTTTTGLLDQILGSLPDDQPDDPDPATSIVVPSAVQEIALHGLGFGGFHL